MTLHDLSEPDLGPEQEIGGDMMRLAMSLRLEPERLLAEVAR